LADPADPLAFVNLRALTWRAPTVRQSDETAERDQTMSVKEAMAATQNQANLRARLIAASTALVTILSGAMAAAAIVIIGATGGLGDSYVDAPWWTTIAVASMYALAERIIVRLEFRREAIALSLSELPTVVALILLGPIAAIMARLAGGVVTLLLRRTVAAKWIFNLSLFAFESAVAFAIVRFAVGGGEPSSSRLLFAVAIATTVATLIGSLIVAAWISLFEGGLWGRLRQTFSTVALTAPFVSSISAVTVAPLLYGIELLALSIIPIVGIWYALLRLGNVSQVNRDLDALMDFTTSIGRSLDVSVVATSGLDEAMRLIRARNGSIDVFDDDGETLVHLSVGDVGDHPGMDELGRDTIAFGDGAGIAAPIHDQDGILGLLVMSGRQAGSDRFDDDDIDRSATLVSHLATALRRTRLHSAMQHAATHDDLTGHFNRSAFDEAVDAELARPHRMDCPAVLMLDLDNFKDINDTLGHHVGDEVLVRFADRVSSVLGAGDVFARFGGDEFAVFIRRPTFTEVRQVANEILSSSYAPLKLNDLDVVITVSVGVAAVTDDDRESSSVLRRADIAMYAAKRQHAGMETYREELDRRTPERLSLLGDLREALDQNMLTVHFQPKVNLATSTVIGVEALARWEHPMRGWVGPDEFIPVAEETGLIKELTDQVLRASLAAVRIWRDRGLDLRVAVNLSTLDLLDELLAERIAHRLEQHGLSPELLTLEITESSLLSDVPRVMATIGHLDRLGVSLSLDDFGTGYSSLSYLRRLPVSELKVDRSFISNILLEAHDDVIVKSTVDLGHNLGLRVVAEGIENGEVMDRLIEVGCDIGQGYAISRPLDAVKFARWLATTNYIVPRIQFDPVRP
jgi:diguanylate cyclase (GGDEF)-like protein